MQPSLQNSSHTFTGLTQKEADAKLEKYGQNTLPEDQRPSIARVLFKFFKEPMILLLVATAALYLIMGDLNEGLLLSSSVIFVIAISLYQERRSESALQKLKQLSSPRALVLRDGVEKRIPSAEVVPGDIVVLSEGDRAPADGIVLNANYLSLDESLLTGESFPVEKANFIGESVEFEKLPNEHKIFASTLAVRGQGLLRVINTGVKTAVGDIGSSLSKEEPDQLNLSFEIKKMVQLFAWAGAILCIILTVAYGFFKGDWLEAVLIGLATQMALMPEEFPVILAVFMAIGAWRLAQVKVLVRVPSAIERLGSIDILCVDKTGTLTENKMSVHSVYDGQNKVDPSSNSAQLNQNHRRILFHASMASARILTDPMEKAICEIAKQFVLEVSDLRITSSLLKEYPLSDKLLALTFAWKTDAEPSRIQLSMKGAPEAVMKQCNLSAAESSAILRAVSEMAENGLRVLAVAYSETSKDHLPDEQGVLKMTWLGLIGLEDPLRSQVPEAVKMSREAGIRVIMITGDHKRTAVKIASKAGLSCEAEALTGAEVEKLSDSELAEKIKFVNVFARMVPQQKLRLVKLLKDQGHVVAMTGDGVNDAPSLKWADVGISMGARGTDVAREASDIVLLDDNFSSIIAGIRRGRVIFRNIQKAISYVISIHVPIAGLAIFPVVLGGPVILLPAHIVLLELIIDPVCSLAFESLDPDENLMKRKPRKKGSLLFSRRDYFRSVSQGAFILMILFLFHFQLTSAKVSETEIRTILLLVLILSNIGLILADFASGSWRYLFSFLLKRQNLFISLGMTIAITILFLSSFSQRLLQIQLLDFKDFAVAVLVAFFTFLILNLWNRFSMSLKQEDKT